MKMHAPGALLVAALSLCPLACKAASQSAPPSPATELATENEKTVYAVGLVLGRNLAQLSLTPAEIELVKRGISDAASGKKPAVEPEAYGPKIQALAQARAATHAQTEKTKSKTFLDGAAGEAGASRSPSGLVFRTVTAGTGRSPASTDLVKVHYRGTLTDGTEFDSSVKRGQPVEFKLNEVIPCWTEGVQKMKIGEKARLVCPSEIAYGDQGRPPVIPGGATLVFEVELIDILLKK